MVECLGPLLLIELFNDFKSCLEFSKVNMYAYDAHRTTAPSNITELIRMTNKKLLNISEWLRLNKLSASPQKQNLWLLVTNVE